jgi:transposase
MVEAGFRRTQYVRKSFSEKIRPAHLHQRQAWPPKVMIWGSVSSKGPGELFHVQGRMNSGAYCDLIDTCMLPQAQTWFPNSAWIFQQDNAPCHVSQVSRNHMEYMGIDILPWPSNSPDVSPIETAWALLKKELRKRNVCRESLWTMCNHIWHSSPMIRDYCHRIPEDMVKRIQALLKSKGAPILY